MTKAVRYFSKSGNTKTIADGFTLFEESRFEYAGKSVGSWSYLMKL